LHELKHLSNVYKIKSTESLGSSGERNPKKNSTPNHKSEKGTSPVGV